MSMIHPSHSLSVIVCFVDPFVNGGWAVETEERLMSNDLRRHEGVERTSGKTLNTRAETEQRFQRQVTAQDRSMPPSAVD
mmetsp:Transcript_13585/g.26948  ORF Transcript_13585/g.26948 Transcript_13585/m.26948 type:complete len:80 (+) Transcript_13585:1140-1379(+)